MSEEKTLKELEEQIERLKSLNAKNGLDLSQEIDTLAEKLSRRKQSKKEGLDDWDRVKLARHPDRPDSKDYIDFLVDDFYPLRGDRLFGDDSALEGGLARYEGETIILIAQSKGGDADRVSCLNPDRYAGSISRQGSRGKKYRRDDSAEHLNHGFA
jgi:acetyl-CoA carboxylase carboxyl transferase subunit alpha